MIEEITMYGAVCDNCGKLFRTEDYCAFVDKDTAKSHALDGGWIEHNGELLCPDCYGYNEETDEYYKKEK